MLPSSRLRNDLAGLEGWARLAPPEADECDWSAATYAANIRSILSELDLEFANMQLPDSAHVCSSCGSLILRKEQ
jgi:hypothetical protein